MYNDRDAVRAPPGGWGPLDEGTVLTDVSELRNEFGNLFAYGDWDDPDVLVSIKCDCGHHNNFAGPQYERYFEVLDDDPFIVRCGKCEDEYRARLIQKGAPRYPLVVECVEPIAWVEMYDLDDDPAYIEMHDLKQTNDGASCPSCGRGHADGNAPEVGWEYYECPDCDGQYLPERVEGTG
jgi:hypothetical protein